MKDKQEEPQFRTHIPEPRWQQIASVVLVILVIIGWLLLSAIHHK